MHFASKALQRIDQKWTGWSTGHDKKLKGLKFAADDHLDEGGIEFGSAASDYLHHHIHWLASSQLISTFSAAKIVANEKPDNSCFENKTDVFSLRPDQAVG